MIWAVAREPILPFWLQVIIGAAVALTTVGAAWTKVIKPIAKVVIALEEQGPAITKMALEFENNGGSSLKDVVDGHTASLAALSDGAAETKGVVDGLADRLEAIDKYSHDRWHAYDQLATIAQIQSETLTGQLVALHETSKDLAALPDAVREAVGDGPTSRSRRADDPKEG